MREEKTEGIVLRSVAYQEQKRIITLFTKEWGLLSLIAKRISPKNLRLASLTSPFCQGEFLFVSKRTSELGLFQDGSPIDSHLKLRARFSSLKAASSLCQALFLSQLPQACAPELYTLFILYLKQIPLFEDPRLLAASFHMKLLKHEGIFPPSPPSFFSQQEWRLAEEFAQAKSFEALKKLALSADLEQKLLGYFKEKTK